MHLHDDLSVATVSSLCEFSCALSTVAGIRCQVDGLHILGLAVDASVLRDLKLVLAHHVPGNAETRTNI